MKSEQIMPYDDVRAVLLASKSFSLRDCICRLQQDHMDRSCDFPLATCLSFSDRERPLREGDISQAEALALLDWCEETGLVHTVSNVMQGLGYVCNCCGCCCGILRGINDYGIQKSVAYANYFAVIDAALCSDCGACRERCPVQAVVAGEGASLVERERCIGCGLCVTGCPNEVARLERKPEAELVLPPVDYGAWELARLQDRGML
jgi:ferredoxin